MREIRRVAVLGAGTMGARIAAHFANVCIPALLLDLVPTSLTAAERAHGLSLTDRAVRNRLAQAGLDAALKAKPAAFFTPDTARLVTVGNLEDDLPQLSGCDWIIEAIVENREAKRALLERVDRVRAPGSVGSSNTSGISISSLAEGRSDDFRRHWLGTHFFNPPRYMKLLEVIPTDETLPEVVEGVSRFGDVVLGKGVVQAKDTPNFIANRIGTFFTLAVFRIMQEGGYTIEEIDALTGPVLGLPKSATFRTLDLVGLDVFDHVVHNLAESLPHDERRDLFQSPGFVSEMTKRGLLGEKTGQGFYKRAKSGEIVTLDLSTFEYRGRRNANFASLAAAKNIEDVRARVAQLLDAKDRAGDFYRSLLPETFHYAASRIPEIADDIVAVDNAVKWAFNWECGVFELLDAAGVERVTEGWRKQGKVAPPLVEKLLGSDRKTFYERGEGKRAFFDPATAAYRPIPEPAGVILLGALKDQGREIRRNAGASFVDLGDGALCLEFHSKMNTIGEDTVQMIHAGLKTLREHFDAMVIGNQAPNFSAGANLLLLLLTIQEGDWDEMDRGVRAFQNANLALKYAPKPVVAAPFGLTLGGGAEICLHCARQQAAAEAYVGLVETGVGLLPAGGGAKEMLLRAMDAVPDDLEADPFARVKEIFTTMGTAKVSTSAEDARRLGYLAAADLITMNRARQIADAKRVALDLARVGYRPGAPRTDIRVLGRSAFAKMKLGLHLMRRAEYISDYDVVVATELARVLSGGGELTSPQRVGEQFLLDLEREAFLKLCGERRTLERIQHTLKTGKPLRN